MKYYVSLNGNDKNDGSPNSPFRTLDRAKRAAKEANEDVEIVIGSGRYFFNKSFVITKEDCNGCRITYKADGEVFFDGGIVIDGKLAKKVTDKAILNRIIDESARKKLMMIDLSDYDINYADYGVRGFRRAYVPSGNELYIDSKPQIVAQYPNAGKPEIPLTEVVDTGSIPMERDYSMRPFTFKYDDSRCDLWKEAKNFYVSGIFKWAWADDTVKVASIDTENKTITSEIPTLFGMIANPYSRWHAIGLLEEIDVPGEYFVDRDTKAVYFYPEADVSESLIQLSVLGEPMIKLMDAENITFSGITIENSRGTGVYIEGGRGCRVDTCILRNLGMVAVQIGMGATALPEGRHNCHGHQDENVGKPESASGIIGSWHEMLYEFAAWNNNGGFDHGVESCQIYDTGTGGILLCGGDRKTLTPAGNFVNNCHITRINRLDKTYKGGINIMGVGNRISHCKIHDMPGFGIYLHGNDHIIEYNDISDCITEVSDAGAFYMGRDVTEAGNVIRYNFFHDIHGYKGESSGACAIYFDDGASFNRIYGNFFYKVYQYSSMYPGGSFGVIFWGWGSQTSVSNNIFFDCPCVTRTSDFSGYILRDHYMEERGDVFVPRTFAKSDDDFRGIDVESDVYREKYPYMYNIIAKGEEGRGTQLYNNMYPLDKSFFKDVDNLDFTILEPEKFTEVFTPSVTDPIAGYNREKVYFEHIDFSKIGIQKK